MKVWLQKLTVHLASNHQPVIVVILFGKSFAVEMPPATSPLVFVMGAFARFTL